MAIVPLHRQITRTALVSLGFGEAAIRIASDANAEVDEKQGSIARESNLHAMRGYVQGVMQTHERAVEAVEALLRRRVETVRNALFATPPDVAKGLEELGAGLHTVQDRAYHHFEPWPFAGIGDAIFNAERGAAFGLAPHYMLCHGLRDMGAVSGPFMVQPSALDYAGGYSSSGGAFGRLSAEATFTFSQNEAVPRVALGGEVQFGSGRTDGAFGISLRWGAPPSQSPALLPPVPRFSRSAESERERSQLCPEVTQAIEAAADAMEASKTFVRLVQTRVNDSNRWVWLQNAAVSPRGQ